MLSQLYAEVATIQQPRLQDEVKEGRSSNAQYLEANYARRVQLQHGTVENPCPVDHRKPTCLHGSLFDHKYRLLAAVQSLSKIICVKRFPRATPVPFM